MDHQGQLHPFLGHMRYYHRDPWEATYGRPLRLYNQHFGGSLVEENMPPLDSYAMLHPNHNRRYWIPKESGVSQINCTEDEFEVKLDVHQFQSSELSVKVAENYVVVEGKHEEQEDPHGLISRHFKRRYKLPENIKDEELTVNLSSDGALIIRGPRQEDAHHDSAATKFLKIHETGKPAELPGSPHHERYLHRFHSLH